MELCIAAASRRMIDIHCHPLPEVDDGAKSLEIAVEMCRMAAANGTTHLVATPHSNYHYAFDPVVNRAKLEALQEAAGPVPKLLLGCDFHLSFENVQKLGGHSAEFTINRTSYLLVEFAEQFVPEQMDHVFFEIEAAGLTPILTHPERNSTIQRKPELLYHWVNRGCLVQITAMSYTGGFGRQAKSLSEEWLDRNLVHLFASDAHDVAHRTPNLKPCYERLTREKGRETADRLLTANPSAVIEGLPLPPAPLPTATAQARKRRWFSFLARKADLS